MNIKRKIEEVQKIIHNPKSNLFKPEEGHYKPIRIGNAFSSNFIEYKSNGDEDKSLLVKEYINMIRPYLSDTVNDYKTQGEWKTHLTMTIHFFSSKDSEETYTMYSKSDNIEVMIGRDTDKIIEDLLNLLYKDVK